MTAIQEGDVETPVGTLRCTLRAAKMVDAHFGDYRKAAIAVDGLSRGAIVFVVAAGLGKKVEEVEDDVFKAGHAALATPVAEFVVRLANGGKMPNNDTGGASPGEA